MGDVPSEDGAAQRWSTRIQMPHEAAGPLSAAYAKEARYVGYKSEDERRPYARFFKPNADAIQPQVRDALLDGPAASHLVIEIEDLASQLSKPGYLELENGYAELADGRIYVAVLTRMPGVTPQMWDWWFGWHIAESARYKLWQPESHVFALPAFARSDDAGLSDKQKYIGNVSYVDEYIGDRLLTFAIGFIDPKELGFEDRGDQATVICGRNGSSQFPLLASWLVHQVRRTPDGAEMRSRFYLNDFAFVKGTDPNVVAALVKQDVVGKTRRPAAAARALIAHCGSEMNHLAGFLPALYAAFKSQPSAE